MNQRSRILIIIGVLFIISGVIIIINNNKGNDNQSVDSLNESQKQELFREFLAGKFPEEYFKVNPMISSGEYNDADLKVDYEFSRGSGHILLYTKWIKQYFNKTIHIASEEELDSFRKHSGNAGTPAYKIIGIGGRPDRPKLLYVIPVSDIHGTNMSIFQIKSYKVPDVFDDFYFDAEKQTLQ